MVIWPAFRMRQCLVNDLPYYAPQFIFEPRLKINDCNIYDRAKSIYFKYILFHINLFDNEVLFISPVNTINNLKLLKIINQVIALKAKFALNSLSKIINRIVTGYIQCVRCENRHFLELRVDGRKFRDKIFRPSVMISGHFFFH